MSTKKTKTDLLVEISQTSIKMEVKIMKNSALTGFKSRYDYINNMISRIDNKIRLYPAGRLRINRRSYGIYYYLVDDTTDMNGRPLKDLDQQLISDLMQKQYLTNVLKTAIKERDYLEKLIKRYPAELPEDVYGKLCQERKDRVKPIVIPEEEFIKEWQDRPFETKGIKDGLVRFTTMKGEEVRSKSEKIIADYLLANNIPYKYECPLKLPGGIIHPDFTILRVSDRKEIYHEHLGMMDKADYTGDQPRRFNMYVDGGIMPGDRLFMSFESNDYPLDIKVIDKIAKTCFL